MKPVVEIRRHSTSRPWTYADLDRRQRELAAPLQRSSCGFRGALLISELAPVITLGRRTPDTDLLLDKAELLRRGIELARVDRGGLATSHGPGQWVVFAVDRLERLTGDPRGVRRAIDGLLAIALEVGRLYDPNAEIRGGPEMGVWTAKGKFAAVGVHVENGVLLHGLAINGFRTPTSFSGLRPCGLEPRVDYLLEQAGLSDADSLEPRFKELSIRIRDAALRVFWTSPGFGAIDFGLSEALG